MHFFFVHFDITTSKSGPNMVCFVHFDLEMCFTRHNGLQFFISHLATWPRTRRFSSKRTQGWTLVPPSMLRSCRRSDGGCADRGVGSRRALCSANLNTPRAVHCRCPLKFDEILGRKPRKEHAFLNSLTAFNGELAALGRSELSLRPGFLFFVHLISRKAVKQSCLNLQREGMNKHRENVSFPE